MKSIKQIDDYQHKILLKNDYKEKCEKLTDFINTFKDELPFSKKLEGDTMDIFYKTMDLMIDNNLKLSASKRYQYKESKFNIEMNNLPTSTHLYENIGMEKDCYEKWANRQESTPRFVYLYDLKDYKIEHYTSKYKIDDVANIKCLISGIYTEDGKNLILCAKLIAQDGTTFEGHFKDNLKHGFGRLTDKDGNREEGFWRNGKKIGKFEYYLDGNNKVDHCDYF